MGLLGKYLNDVCDRRPDLAQQLLEREIGPLGDFFSTDGKCGCVVMTLAMADGFRPDRLNLDLAVSDAYGYLALGLGLDPDLSDAACMRVHELSLRLAIGPLWRDPPLIGTTRRSDALTVHLIRTRIAVRLAMVGVA